MTCAVASSSTPKPERFETGWSPWACARSATGSSRSPTGFTVVRACDGIAFGRECGLATRGKSDAASAVVAVTTSARARGARCESLGNARFLWPLGPLVTPAMWRVFLSTENCAYGD